MTRKSRLIGDYNFIQYKGPGRWTYPNKHKLSSIIVMWTSANAVVYFLQVLLLLLNYYKTLTTDVFHHLPQRREVQSIKNGENGGKAKG